MEQWTTTKDLRVAAALGSMGMVVRVKKTHVAASGNREVDFMVSTVDVERQWKTAKILSDWKKRKLEADHPFLTMLRAFESRERVLDFQKKGEFCRLVRVPGTRVHQYVRSTEGLPGYQAGDVVIRTGDLKMVAALGVAGLPLLAMAGSEPRMQYVVQAYAMIDGQKVDGIELLRQWRQNPETVPWEEPFAQAARGLHNRERLLDAARKAVAVVLIQKPKSWRTGVVREDASDAAFETVKEFLEE